MAFIKFLTDNIMIFLPYRMWYPVSNNMSMGSFDYCQFKCRKSLQCCQILLLGMHRNENSWPKPNKIKHWAEGRIPNMVFPHFFPHVGVRPLSCVSCVPASCFHIWFVSCPRFMSLWVNSVPGVCVIMCLLSGVFKSCLLSSMSSGLLVTPVVPVCLPYLDVVNKDYYFELPPRLRVPASSLLCAPWQQHLTAIVFAKHSCKLSKLNYTYRHSYEEF